MRKRVVATIRFLCVVSLVGFLGTLLPRGAMGQKPPPPLTVRKIVGMLEAGVAESHIGDLVRAQGVTFPLTRENEKQLRDGGAGDELIRVIRQVAPKPTPTPTPTPTPHPTPTPTPTPSPQPPVLSIQSSPGDAEAYVDDERVGTTSPEGRLKVPQLSPGQHTVRLSHTGYQDHEEAVTLEAGKTATVTARLEAVKLPSPTPTPTPTPSPTPSPGPSYPSSGTPGRLGVELMNPQPPGVPGVVVSGVDPGGPASQAGIRAYSIIIAVNYQHVKSPEDLQQIMTSHRAGEVITINFYNGTQAMTRQVRLATPSSQVSVNPTPTPTPTPSTPRYSPRGGYQPSYNPPRATPSGTAFFYVVHDHGPPAPNFCVGKMSIDNGVLHYRSTTGIHPLDIPLSDIKEAKKNAVYLADFGAFHIRLKKGNNNYNFVVVNQQGQYQPPNNILNVINGAMGH